MRLSSGFVWRHGDSTDFRADAPTATRRSSDCSSSAWTKDLDWLESLGAPVVEPDTGNPLTTGMRFEPEG